MDVTRPQGYPFPQCDPPVTQDASDIIQMANLALTIDADIQSMFNVIDNNLLTPDGCHLAATVTQTIQQTDAIQFNTVRFDNTPGLAMSETGGMRTQSDGIYLVTGWAQVDQGPTPPLDNLKFLIMIQGVGIIQSEGLATNVDNLTRPGEVNGSTLLHIPAGSLIQASVQTSGTVTLDVEFCEFSAVRLGPR